ncbi:MAG: saccharopine dehydrogenase C-terminal domain-containing protein [Enterobacterales bacterium]|nr:saccharopine dehydrogenase C-terminal domain-containing protein [Enterobacterales bacterium]
MAKIIVLGAGLIGRAVALDLAEAHQVCSVDLNKKALAKIQKENSAVETINFDLAKSPDYTELLAPFDLVISSVPGYLGFDTLKKILLAGKNAVDASCFPENCFDLDHLAKKNNVYAVVDCGLAPGMDNIILGHLDTKMEVNRFECLVGGLPVKRHWPFNFRSLFSPIDLLHDYNGPARYVENGELVIKDALSDCELMDIKRVGTLEAFNTDGLRTLIKTMQHIPYMKEKTLRYPGHCEYLQVLKSSGFFDTQPIELNGMEFSPIDVSAKILERDWALGNNEEELTVVRTTIEGEENGKKRRYIYRLLDKTDKDKGITSMARTNGYTATAVTNFILKKPLESGICAPETLGAIEGAFKFILQYLEDRDINYRIEESTLTDKN